MNWKSQKSTSISNSGLAVDKIGENFWNSKNTHLWNLPFISLYHNEEKKLSMKVKVCDYIFFFWIDP